LSKNKKLEVDLVEQLRAAVLASRGGSATLPRLF
jgi:hypothetical protein